VFLRAAYYRHAEFRQGARDMFAVTPGFAAWGLMTGVAMVKSGMSVIEAILMTVLVYAGSAQLAAIPLLVAGAPAWVILATAFCVNLRFVVFSAHLRAYLMHLPLGQRLLTGFLTFLVTFLFGIDFALLWGVLAFLFNYIPYVGSFVSVTPPILLSLMQNESIGTTLALIIVLLIVHQGTGTFIETYMMGSKLNLSPLVIIMALAFWGQVWGIIGMILAVPLMVVLKTFLGSITETKFLASLLSTPETKHPPSAML